MIKYSREFIFVDLLGLKNILNKNIDVSKNKKFKKIAYQQK